MLPIRFEIIPTQGIVEEVAARLPTGTTVTVTCLPHHGIERTVKTSLELADRGYVAVPHLAARSVASHQQLARIVADCRAAGINEVFVIGGDRAQSVGPYADSAALMLEIADLSGKSLAMSVGGYPEGHPTITKQRLLQSLLATQDLAASIVTQMCFSATAIASYQSELLREGVTLPVLAGVAGSVPRAKLVSLATKIGVGSSLRFISKKGPLGRRLLSGSHYQPEGLITELAALPVPPAGIHLYSFNSLDNYATSPP